MKRLLLVLPFLVTFFATMALWAQVPQGISYQAVVRNANNRIAVNQSVKVKLSVLQGSETGSPVYCEIHLVQTNINGLFNVEIGKGMQGNCGSFDNIKWGEGPFYLKSEVDLNNDNDFSDFVATQKMLSVPYALYAEKAGHLVGFTDTISLDAHILAIRNRAQANSATLRQDLLSLRNNTRTADSLANDRIDSLLAWTYGYDSLLNARFISFMDSSIVINKKMDDSLFFRVDSLLNGHNVDFSSVNGRVDSLAAVVTNRYVGHRDSIVFLYDTIVNHMANREYAKKIDDSLYARIDSVIVVMKANYDTLDSIAYYWDTVNYNRLMAKIAGDSAFLNDSIDQVAQNLSSAVSTIQSNFNNYYTKNKVNDTVSYVLDSIRDVAGTLKDTAKYLNDSIDQVAQNLSSAVSSINGNFNNYYTKNKVNDTVSYVLDSIRNVAGTLNDTAKYLNDSIDQVAQNLSSAVSSINSNFNNYYTKNKVNDTVSYVLDSIRNVAGTLNDTAKYLNDSIDNVAQNLSSAVSTIQSNFDNYYTKNEIKDTVGYIYDSIRNVAGTLNDTAKYLNDSIDNVAAALNDTANAHRSRLNALEVAVNTHGADLTNLQVSVGTLNDDMSALKETVKDTVKFIMDSLRKVNKTLWDTAGYFFDSINDIATTLNDTARYFNTRVDSTSNAIQQHTALADARYVSTRDSLTSIYDTFAYKMAHRAITKKMDDSLFNRIDSVINVVKANYDTLDSIAYYWDTFNYNRLMAKIQSDSSFLNDSIDQVANTLNDTANYFKIRVDSASNAIQQHTALADTRYANTRDSIVFLYDTIMNHMANRDIAKKMDDSLFKRLDSVINVVKANYDTLDSIAYYWDTANYNKLMAKIQSDSSFLNDSIDQVANTLNDTANYFKIRVDSASNAIQQHTALADTRYANTRDSLTWIYDTIANRMAHRAITKKMDDSLFNRIDSVINVVKANYDTLDSIAYYWDTFNYNRLMAKIQSDSSFLNDSINKVVGRFNSLKTYVSNTYYTKNKINDTIKVLRDSIRDVAGTLNDTAKYLNDSIDQVAQNLSSAVSSINSNFNNYYTSEKVKDTLGYIYDSIRNVAGTLNDTAKYLNDSIDQVANTLNNTANYFKIRVDSSSNAIQQHTALADTRYANTRDSLTWIYDTIANRMAHRDISKKMDDSLFNRLDSVINVVKANYDTLDSIAYYWDTANYNRLLAKVNKNKTFLNDSIDSVAQNLSNAVATINTEFSKYYKKRKIQDTISYVLDSIRDVASTMNDTVNYLNDSIDKVAQNLSSAVSSIYSDFSNYYTNSKIEDTIDYIFDSIRNIASTLNDTVNYLNDSIDNVAQNLSNAVSTIQSNFNNYYTKTEINDTVSYVLDSIRNVAGTMNDTARYFKARVDSASNAIQQHTTLANTRYANTRDSIVFLYDTIMNHMANRDIAKKMDDSLFKRLDSVINVVKANYDTLDSIAYYWDTANYNKLMAKIHSDSVFLHDSIDKMATKAEIINHNHAFDTTNSRINVLKGRVDSIENANNLSGVLSLGNDAGAMPISNLADPTQGQDAVTLSFMQTFVRGLVDSLSNVTLGLQQQVDKLRDSLNTLHGYVDRMTTFRDTNVYFASFPKVIRGKSYPTYGVYYDTLGSNKYGLDSVLRIHILEDYALLTQGENDTFLIKVEQDLAIVADMLDASESAFTGKVLKLNNDIVCVNPVMPIGINNPFNGTFDGANHAITITKFVNMSNRIALFANATGGTIKNLTVKGDVELSFHVDSDALYVSSILANYGTVESCSNEMNIKVSNTGSADLRVAGITGAPSTKVINSYNKGKIEVSGATKAFIGGIVAGGTHVYNCYNVGELLVSNVSSELKMGGIAATITGSYKMENCFANGEMRVNTTPLTAHVSAIVGDINASDMSNVKYCYVNKSKYYLNGEMSSIPFTYILDGSYVPVNEDEYNAYAVWAEVDGYFVLYKRYADAETRSFSIGVGPSSKLHKVANYYATTNGYRTWTNDGRFE